MTATLFYGIFSVNANPFLCKIGMIEIKHQTTLDWKSKMIVIRNEWIVFVKTWKVVLLTNSLSDIGS